MIPKGEMDEKALDVPMRAWILGFASIVTGTLGLYLFNANLELVRGLPEKIDDIIESHNLMRPDKSKESSIADWGARQLMANVTKGSPVTDYEVLSLRTFFPLSQASATVSLKVKDGRTLTARLHFIGSTCHGASEVN